MAKHPTMPDFITFPLSLAVWVDAVSNQDWAEVAVHQGKRPVRCATVGFLLFQDKDCVVLASSLNELQHGADSITIPRACLVSLRRIA